MREDPEHQDFAPIAHDGQTDSEAVIEGMHDADVDRQRPHARDVWMEGDVLPEELVIPEHDRQAAERHQERVLHRHPMVGIELRVVRVPVMGEMHVAERLVLVQQDRAAGKTDEMVEPEPAGIAAGDVAVAGLVQRRLIGVENERVEDQSEPEGNDPQRAERADRGEGGDDADGQEHGRPGHHALIRLNLLKRLPVSRGVRLIAGDFGDRGFGDDRWHGRSRALRFVLNKP